MKRLHLFLLILISATIACSTGQRGLLVGANFDERKRNVRIQQNNDSIADLLLYDTIRVQLVNLQQSDSAQFVAQYIPEDELMNMQLQDFRTAGRGTTTDLKQHFGGYYFIHESPDGTRGIIYTKNLQNRLRFHTSFPIQDESAALLMITELVKKVEFR